MTRQQWLKKHAAFQRTPYGITLCGHYPVHARQLCASCYYREYNRERKIKQGGVS